MDISFNFLLQATRVLYVGNYDEQELIMIYDYMISLDRETLIDYNDQCNVLTYNNDLELYLEIITSLIKIFELKEEYEKCDKLFKKQEECIEIIKNKTI